MACPGDGGHGQLAITLAGPDMASRNTEPVCGPHIFTRQLYLPILNAMVTQLLTGPLNTRLVAVTGKWVCNTMETCHQMLTTISTGTGVLVLWPQGWTTIPGLELCHRHGVISHGKETRAHQLTLME